MTNSPGLTNQQLSAASRLFSPTVFRELAHSGCSPVFARLANELLALEYIDTKSPIRDLFDSIFDRLTSKDYRHEFIYKSVIAHKILLGKHSLNTAVLLNEFRVGDCKADVVVINGTSNVYEIKSERDSLCRLKKQISTYQNVFANVNVITGNNHLSSVFRTTPDSVGVLLLNDRYQISTIRESKNFSCNIKAESIFDSIHLSESKAILKNLGIEIPEVPNTMAYSTFKSIFKELPNEVAHEQMVKILKKTRDQSNLSTFLDLLPNSMISIALNTRITRHDRIRLLSALDTPLHNAISWH